MNRTDGSDGGPAFPQDLQGRRGDDPALQGMSLRDWLAGHASEKDIEEHRYWSKCHATGTLVARFTREQAKFRYADAMLKAREES